jgi:hypothetical protein
MRKSVFYTVSYIAIISCTIIGFDFEAAWAHDEQVHEKITLSAFQSSSGLNEFRSAYRNIFEIL